MNPVTLLNVIYKAVTPLEINRFPIVKIKIGVNERDFTEMWRTDGNTMTVWRSCFSIDMMTKCL